MANELYFAKAFGRLRINRCAHYGQSQENHVDYTLSEDRARWKLGLLATKYLKCVDNELNVHLGSLKVYNSSDSLKSKNIPHIPQILQRLCDVIPRTL